MKTNEKISKSILIATLITGAALLLPLVLMKFTDEVNWSISDFTIVGVLIFATALSYRVVTQRVAGLAYKLAFAMALGTTLVMIWANLGVGLIGSGPNAGNLLFIAVLAVAVFGSVQARLNASKMERVMYATSLAIGFLAIIALLTGMQNYPGSSVVEILSVCGFFATLFFVAGLMFRFAAKTGSAANEPGSQISS
jgi:hypothetical protein